MQRVEEFMNEYFKARLLEEKRYQASRVPFRRKFFTDECKYDARLKTLATMESEKIVSIDQDECEAKVITDYTFDYWSGPKTLRSRYRLQRRNGDWLIRSVQTACHLCGARADIDCKFCKGKGWLGEE